MPDTAAVLRNHNPQIEPWVLLNKDGTYSMHDFPMSRLADGRFQTKSERGTWGIRSSGLRLQAEGGNGGLYPELRGQGFPYIIEYWGDRPMEFCADPSNSPAVLARKQVLFVEFSIQGVFLISLVILPFFLQPGPWNGAYRYPFMIAFFWGIWRMGFCDEAMNDDVPGMAYLVCAVVYPLIPLGISTFRRHSVLHNVLRRRKHKLAEHKSITVV